MKKHHAQSLFDFTNSLQPVRRIWLQAVSQVLADSGLSTSMASAVILAARRGDEGIRQSALAEDVGVNPGAMVRILDQAEEAGLLARRSIPNNRRSKMIFVLPAGKTLAANMEVAIAELRAEILGDLSVEEIESATRLMRLFEKRTVQFLQKKPAQR